MAANRFQVSAAMDTAFQRDRLVNVLWFEDIGTSDQDGLCGDLAAIFDTHVYSRGNPEITVKSYDNGTPPNLPIGEATINPGGTLASSCPREVALCLSFYAGVNAPRTRGRIFLPACGFATDARVRPTSTFTDMAMALAQDLADLGGADVSWNVHSATTGEDNEVTNAWCDDEWDTIRSRGLRATTRATAATGS